MLFGAPVASAGSGITIGADEGTGKQANPSTAKLKMDLAPGRPERDPDHAARFTVKSATQIAATVPKGASSGGISVTTPGGTATSSSSFTVK